MFYPAEFITLTRRGKLAKCWLAATSTEQKYKQIFGLNSIKSIDISALCDEILEAVEIRPTRPYGKRFSLYLSSQLMYGTVKLLFYQTTSVERQLFVIKSQLHLDREVTKHRMETDVLSHFQLPDLPSVSQDFNNIQIDDNLHLISDEPNLNAGMELMMHAECLNFGILTDDDLDYMLMLGKHLQDEPMDIVEPRQTGISSSALLPDNQESFMEGVVVEETRVQQAKSDNLRNGQKEELIAIEDIEPRDIMDDQLAQGFSTIVGIQLNGDALPTPKKRQSTGLQTDTPTKRRRLDFDDVQSQQPMLVEEASPLILEELSVEHNIAVQTQKHKVRKVLDNKIEIETKNFIRWINNIMAHTEPQIKLQINIPSAAELFQMPVTCMQKICAKTWVNPLRILFDKHINTKSNIGIEPIVQITADIDDPRLQEIVRHSERVSKTMEVSELSAAVADMAIETEYSKTLERTANEMLEVQPLSPIKSESIERLSSNTHIETAIAKVSESSSSLSQNGKLSKNDLLAMLEVHWYDREIIKFNEVISPSSYTVLDAARAFKLLLELHSENKVILKQSEAYEPIWIQKYIY